MGPVVLIAHRYPTMSYSQLTHLSNELHDSLSIRMGTEREKNRNKNEKYDKQ